MSKRVLVNLHDYDPTLEPYWTFVPTNLVHYTPKPVAKPRPKQDPPKAFANPYAHGYGGGETPWPFDHTRAYRDGRYRAGIRNAINADWTASHWKYYANQQLNMVLQHIAEDYEGGYQRRYINRSNYADMIMNFESIIF